MFGMDLNKPHTSEIALCTCLCMLVFLLQPLTINLKKKKHLNTLQKLNIHGHVHFASVKGYCQTVALRWKRLWAKATEIETSHVCTLPELTMTDCEGRWLSQTRWLTQVTSGEGSCMNDAHSQQRLSSWFECKLSPCLCSSPGWQTLLLIVHDACMCAIMLK